MSGFIPSPESKIRQLTDQINRVAAEVNKLREKVEELWRLGVDDGK